MNRVIDLNDFEQEPAHFDSLMPFKVKDILLVSSLYDIYNLREDGQLANMVMSEYAELRLSRAPTIKRVDSGEGALEAMAADRALLRELALGLKSRPEDLPARNLFAENRSESRRRGL